MLVSSKKKKVKSYRTAINLYSDKSDSFPTYKILKYER